MPSGTRDTSLHNQVFRMELVQATGITIPSLLLLRVSAFNEVDEAGFHILEPRGPTSPGA